jgi:hypothetical protein
MRLFISRPKCSLNHFFCGERGKVVKSSPKICPLLSLTKKLPKVNDHTIGENAPDLVTLIAMHMF